MAHVLRVAALKLGHPVGVLVLMEANDFLFHRQRAQSVDYLPALFDGSLIEHRLLFRRLGAALDFVGAEQSAPLGVGFELGV